MADIKLFVKQPYIGFYTDASSTECRIQWDFAPVVVVRMTCHGSDVPGYVSWPVRQTFAILPNLTPVIEYPVKLVREEGGKATENDA